MLEKVKAIVAEGLGVDAADLTEETTFESLGADSLDLMDMVMSFEDELSFEKSPISRPYSVPKILSPASPSPGQMYASLLSSRSTCPM